MKGVLISLNNYVSDNEIIKILFRAGFFISILFLIQYIVALPVIIAQNTIVVNIDEKNFMYSMISLLFVGLFSYFEPILLKDKSYFEKNSYILEGLCGVLGGLIIVLR